MGNTPVILWFRNDLRLADNPALHAALATGNPVLPLFIWASDEEGEWSPGAASRWWLHHSLVSLGSSLERIDSRLVVRTGKSLDVLKSLIKETRATHVFWNRRYEPALITRDKAIKSALQEQGVEVGSFNGALLHEPWTIQNKGGNPFQVFTPFWKTCVESGDPAEPLPAPSAVPSPGPWPESVPIDALQLLPKLNWADGFVNAWTPGERGARENLDRFVQSALGGYRTERNRPDRTGTSRLSPHLHFGEISPRQIWHAVREVLDGADNQKDWRRSQFLSEIGWREFAHHLLFHFPSSPSEPLRERFAAFPWRDEPEWLRDWQAGRTGYPLVDAGMRELWATGWMHNRVRMVVGSFLVKDLLIDWRRGAEWFWDTLVDADLANNSLGWQWISGCGADAAPYFRIFNPIAQGEQYDPNGDYVRRWVPELAKLPANWIHRPFEAPPHVLNQAGVEIGVTYPEPIVNHRIAREVALDAYNKVKD